MKLFDYLKMKQLMPNRISYINETHDVIFVSTKVMPHVKKTLTQTRK